MTFSSRLLAVSLLLLALASPGLPRPAAAQDFRVLEDSTGTVPNANQVLGSAPPQYVLPRILLAGDSWAQYMWDDGSHNDILDKFGQEDRRALSLSLGSDPGPGHAGPEYAISGSEARQWVDTANYPWIANMTAALQANPTIDLVILSIGGNDVLAGKPGGGWYKDMDLDVPGSEAAFFDRLEEDTFTIINAALAVRPNIRVMISSYEYPNFNVGFWCFAYACPKRRDLSRDPDNDLITDQELNDMMVRIEQRRIAWVNSDPRLLFDHGIGLMHYFYGDGVAAARTLPYPGQEPPLFAPFPGGNVLRPSLRSNFRRPNGLDADPIHLNYAGYQYKISNTTQAFLFPWLRGDAAETFASLGGTLDGWTDGSTTGTTGLRIGDTGLARAAGILTFDTSAIPDGATITGAALYLVRDSLTGGNPFTSGALGVPTVDLARGSFGAPAIEPGDLAAPADAVDAGYMAGSVKANGYALRVELNGAGLLAIHDAGTTQLRLAFPATGGASGADYVLFRDGDWPAPVAAGLPTLADYMGSSTPFLDVAWVVPSGVPGDTEPAAGGAMRAPSPNPFRASTTLRFTLDAAGPARLEIFDITGRRVATLLDAELPAGNHDRAWDGRNESGSPVAAGLFLARLSTRTGTSLTRLVRLPN